MIEKQKTTLKYHHLLMFVVVFFSTIPGCKNNQEEKSRAEKPSTPAMQSPTKPPPPKKPSASTSYDVPEYSEPSLAVELKRTCEKAAGKPLLLEFSAPWCTDCRKLHSMKTAPVLETELNNWATLTINIGNFDKHEALLKHFKVKAIAKWIITQPNNCEDSVLSWKRVASRTLEPTGKDRAVTPGALAGWLRQRR